MKSVKIKKGDLVRIITGKDRGKSGRTERVLPRQQRLVVAGVNLAKKHVRQSTRRQPGGIVTKPLTISISNVMLICPNCQKMARVGVRMTGEYNLRVCKKCGQNVDQGEHSV